MSGEGDDDIGFTQAQQDWIHQLIANQQRDAIPRGNSSQNKETPPVPLQSQSAGNLGERLITYTAYAFPSAALTATTYPLPAQPHRRIA